MADLIYPAITSLDGYIEDKSGQFDWAEPDEELHQFFNDLERTAGTSLYGRRMYETMAVWETDPGFTAGSPVMEEFAAIWQAGDKIVFSRTLQSVATTRTRLEREFEPDAIRELKRTAKTDISIGGPGLAAHAFRSGLIDQIHLFLSPISLGGGKPSLPEDVRLELELLEERRFGNGTVHLHYRTKQASAA